MKKDNLLKFYLLVFGISWVGVLPSLLIAHGINLPDVLKHLHWLMTLGPISATVIYLYLEQGPEAVRKLFRKVIRFRASSSVILFTLILPIALAVIAAFVGLYLSDTPWPAALTPTTIPGNAIAITIMYLIINSE